MNADTIEALIEVTEYYIWDLKANKCTKASIDYFTSILKELEDMLPCA